MEANLHFKIDWASLIPYFWTEIYCFSLFYFVLQDNFQGLYLEGRFNGRFFALRVWRANIWYIWRGLFSEFYGIWRQRLTRHCNAK